MKELPSQIDYDFQNATKEGFKLGLGVGVAPGILFCALKLYTENRGSYLMQSITEIETIKETAFLMTKILGISMLAGVTLTTTQVLINKFKDLRKNYK